MQLPIRSSSAWLRLLLVAAVVAACVPLMAAPAAALITEARVIHVDAEVGDDSEGDGSEEAPFQSITRGMEEAEEGDTVLVAPGEYSWWNESLPIQMESGVTLTSSDGPQRTRILGDYFDCLFEVYGAEDAVIEGFTLSRGMDLMGGAIGVIDSSVTLRDLTITGNSSFLLGGAIAAYGSEVDIEGCEISENGWEPDDFYPVSAVKPAAVSGIVLNYLAGGLYAQDCTVTISGTAFEDNGAAYTGGAIILGGSTLVADDVSFTDNQVVADFMDIDSASMPADVRTACVTEEPAAGAIHLAQGSTARISDATFEGNEAMFSSAINVDYSSTLDVSGSSFTDNYSFVGTIGLIDGLGLIGGKPAATTPAGMLATTSTVDACTFEGNTSEIVSGVASVFQPVDVTNSLFTGNYDWGTTLGMAEGGSVMNCTITDNWTDVSVSGACEVVNSIVWGNDGPEYGIDAKTQRYDADPKVAEIFVSAVSTPTDFDGPTVTYTLSNEEVEGEGNLTADPMFSDPDGGDYRLAQGSPAIDAGTDEGAPAWDLDFLSRPADGDYDGDEEFDMGAYEAGRVERVAGADRYKTAVEVSRSRFDSAEVVVIATGRTFADGLAGAGLAGIYDAPLLLTRPLALPGEVAAEIGRLGAERAIILGAEPAVAEGVEDALVGLGLDVERIGGYDRYETAALIAMRIVEETGDDFSGVAFVARGDLFPDALAVSPAAYALGAPTLLARPDEMPAATVDVLDLFELSDVVIAGSEAAVGPKAAEALPDGWTRIGGVDRYATAAAFSQYAAAQGWSSFASVGIATGADFADALSGGAALGADEGVMLLTPPDRLHPAASDVLNARADEIMSLDVLGGPAALNDDVWRAVRSIVD